MIAAFSWTCAVAHCVGFFYIGFCSFCITLTKDIRYCLLNLESTFKDYKNLNKQNNADLKEKLTGIINFHGEARE